MLGKPAPSEGQLHAPRETNRVRLKKFLTTAGRRSGAAGWSVAFGWLKLVSVVGYTVAGAVDTALGESAKHCPGPRPAGGAPRMASDLRHQRKPRARTPRYDRGLSNWPLWVTVRRAAGLDRLARRAVRVPPIAGCVTRSRDDGLAWACAFEETYEALSRSQAGKTICCGFRQQASCECASVRRKRSSDGSAWQVAAQHPPAIVRWRLRSGGNGRG